MQKVWFPQALPANVRAAWRAAFMRGKCLTEVAISNVIITNLLGHF
jgi:hypothetical protein